MENLKKITVLVLLLTFVTACHKDDPTPESVLPNCGCDSPVKATITDKIATLKYDAVLHRKYIMSGNGNIQNIYYICNENLLLQNSINTLDIQVKASGNLKSFCNEPTAGTGDVSFAEITLTQIQQL
jgi:hypothetical protein